MAKIKVAHMITRLDPGGSATNTLETIQRLNKDKFDVFLIYGKTGDSAGDLRAGLQQNRISYAHIPELQRDLHPAKDLMAFWKTFQLFQKHSFDIVHTHTSKAGILGRWAARLAGAKRVVHTPHGHVFYGYFGKIKTQIFIWAERLTALITDKIITLTDRGTQEHMDFKIAPRTKFITVHSGIAVDAQPPFPCAKEREEFQLRNDIPTECLVFGCVGRLEPIKGIFYLLEAMQKVIVQLPHSRLVVVGDGEQKEQLQQHILKLGIINNAMLTGFRADIDRWMACMDVFVLPSLNEGMGRVILEAMRAGKPVVATRVGGIPELVEDGVSGFLVKPKDSEGLAQAMVRLAHDPDLLKTMGEAAKARVSRRFSVEKMVADLEHLYETL